MACMLHVRNIWNCKTILRMFWCETMLAAYSKRTLAHVYIWCACGWSCAPYIDCLCMWFTTWSLPELHDQTKSRTSCAGGDHLCKSFLQQFDWLCMWLTIGSLPELHDRTKSRTFCAGGTYPHTSFLQQFNWWCMWLPIGAVQVRIRWSITCTINRLVDEMICIGDRHQHMKSAILLDRGIQARIDLMHPHDQLQW